MGLNSTIHSNQNTVAFPHVSRNCFAAMQSKSSIALTAPYHVEEFSSLNKVLTNCDPNCSKPEHFVAIGSGNLRYMDVALKYCDTYNAVEMNMDDHIKPEMQSYIKRNNNVNLINKSFSDVLKSELPESSKVFFFLFNVFPYIPNAIASIKNLANPGDVIMISSWNNQSFTARRLRNIYYNHLQSSDTSCPFVPPAYATQNYLDDVEKQTALFTKKQYRRQSSITDILTCQV